MLFNSYRFLFLFFPLVLLIGSRLKGNALLVWLTLASYVFYAMSGPLWFLIPILATTVLDFALAQKMQDATSKKTRRIFLWSSLCANLGLLGYLKS